jgi:hypothetical protein
VQQESEALAEIADVKVVCDFVRSYAARADPVEGRRSRDACRGPPFGFLVLDTFTYTYHGL